MSSTALLSSAHGDTASAAALLENLPDSTLLVEDNGSVVYANTAAERFFGYSHAELVDRVFCTLLAEPYETEYADALHRFANGDPIPGLGQRREVVGLRRDGSSLTMELSLTEVRIGRSRSLAAIARDIRDQKRAEARLRAMAGQDSLTGLITRTGFEHAITRHVEYAARYGSAGSVIALGIDTFKYVNESLRAVAGDTLLAEVAALIRGRIRKTDVLARVGGDVFGILVHGADHGHALALAEELLDIVRRHAFVLDGEGLRITVSAGVRSLDDQTAVGSELLAEAEMAMHAAKEAGRDRVLGFDAEVRQTDDRRFWSERVRQATERGLFILTSQPIVDVASGETTQHEVLLRMRGDGGDGLVAPAAFLATAERFGLIGGVDRWVTQQAVRLIEAHGREGRDLTFEVNLSGRTMTDKRFPEEVSRMLATSGIDPSRLIFEVTETAAVADIEHARRFAHSLARLGCRFALDDFGAGYASFYYLKHLPISYLKIDGEFVRELPNSRTDRLIVKALVDVCAGLGIKTIAEFVSDQRTMDLVRDLGVDYAQGYHLGRPEPVSSLRVPNDG